MGERGVGEGKERRQRGEGRDGRERERAKGQTLVSVHAYAYSHFLNRMAGFSSEQWPNFHMLSELDNKEIEDSNARGVYITP